MWYEVGVLPFRNYIEIVPLAVLACCCRQDPSAPGDASRFVPPESVRDVAVAAPACVSPPCPAVLYPRSALTKVAVSVDGENVYWFEQGVGEFLVQQAPKDGRGPVVTIGRARPDVSNRVVPDGTHVAWMSGDTLVRSRRSNGIL